MKRTTYHFCRRATYLFSAEIAALLCRLEMTSFRSLDSSLYRCHYHIGNICSKFMRATWWASMRH